MADGISFDFSEILKLAADLEAAPAEVSKNVRAAVQVTSLKVKRSAQAKANRRGLAGYARDITYETKETRSTVESEIGPTPGDAGSFGLVEDASGNVRSAPQHAMRDALRENEEDFIKGLLIAISEPL